MQYQLSMRQRSRTVAVVMLAGLIQILIMGLVVAVAAPSEQRLDVVHHDLHSGAN